MSYLKTLLTILATLTFALPHAYAELQVDKLDTVVGDLSYPWGIEVLSENTLVVTERTGSLVVIQLDSSFNSGSVVKRINLAPEIPDLFVNAQAGLFDVLILNSNDDGTTLLLSYACGTQSNNHTCVARTDLSPTYELENTSAIFRSRPGKRGAAHFGGRLLALPDESVLITLGDGFDYREQAQVTSNHFGSIARIYPDGSTPDNNPFVGVDNTLPSLYSYGHRNVQGIAYHPEWNVILSTEHGPRGGDELNQIEAGHNYGWPLLTTGLDYTGASITPHKDLPGMEPYLYQWTPSIAPAGLTLLNNTALIPALAARKIIAVELTYDSENVSVLNEYDILSSETSISLNQRIRDIQRIPNQQAIWVLTDSPSGSILRIELTGTP